VLRGWAMIVEVAPVDDAEQGWLRLGPLDDEGVLYRKHFLHLNGLGIRDLCVQGKDLLILAGPTMDLDGPVTLYRWPGGARPARESVLSAGDLERVLDLPFGQGVDRPEGISLYPSRAGAETGLLVAYDGASPSRQIGESTLVADVFALPARGRRKK